MTYYITSDVKSSEIKNVTKIKTLKKNEQILSTEYSYNLAKCHLLLKCTNFTLITPNTFKT